jgi:hypothetical protein
MSTEKKTASNRNNAQKSTGPKSAAGKAVVSQNARTHGLLSRNLIIDGESREEFSELLSLLAEEFQPVGLVEHALVERVGIALWRQRRLVRAESAEVSLNQQRFGTQQKSEVGKVLNLGYAVYEGIRAPEDGPEETDIAFLENERKLWKSIVDGKAADTDDPFSHLPEILQRKLLKAFAVEISQIDSVVKAKFGSWDVMFKRQVAYYESLIEKQRIREVSRLVMQSQALPSKTDLLARYQTALDNDLYKALKVLHDVQAWRQSKALITATPVLPDGYGGSERKTDPWA